MKKIFHISFNFGKREQKTEELKPAFNKALDWVFYAPNCWLVCTTAEPNIWIQRLRPLLHDEDSIFICEINFSGAFSGFLPQIVWDWIERNSGTKIIDLPALPAPADKDE
jgi:hypothetical protein